MTRTKKSAEASSCTQPLTNLLERLCLADGLEGFTALTMKGACPPLFSTAAISLLFFRHTPCETNQELEFGKKKHGKTEGSKSRTESKKLSSCGDKQGSLQKARGKNSHDLLLPVLEQRMAPQASSRGGRRREKQWEGERKRAPSQ